MLFPSTTRQIVRQTRIAPDPYRAVRERSVEAAPGTAWNYNGGDVWLLGLILKKVWGCRSTLAKEEKRPPW